MTSRLLGRTLVLLLVMTSSMPVVARGDGDDVLTLRGCLLLSRNPEVYALHMVYNRIAAIGHVDLPNHVGHLVVLTGVFEERGDQARFIVEGIAHVAPTCEVQASASTDTAPQA